MTIRSTIFFALLALSATRARAEPVMRWDSLPSLPETLGFAGSFAGTSGGALIVAGGANFPDRPPWEGGTKTWTDRVFVLAGPSGRWVELEGKLPRPLGYGVSVEAPGSGGLICVGGSDARRHFAEVFLVRQEGGKLTRSDLPPLPRPCANACGAVLDGVLYIAGGLAEPGATETLHTFWALEPAAKTWRELEPWPGPPRMLAVAGVQEGAFFLFSGTDLSPGPDGPPRRTYLRDAYRYKPGRGWDKIADLPRPAVAAPSPAAAVGAAHLLVFGGDDGAHVGFQPPDRHPGFPDTLLAYHTITDTWVNAGTTPVPFVTTPLVAWRGGFVVPGGEVRPGVRSPKSALAVPQSRKIVFGLLNLITLAVYPVVMLAIGLHFAGKRKDSDDFFRAGGRIPWWAAGLSIYATMLSSITFMAVPAKAFATDWGFFLNFFSIVVLAPVVIAVYLPFFRQLDVTSAYEYLERRFNLAARLFGSASFMVFQVGRTGIVLYLPALALATVSNLDIHACIIGMGVLTIILTVFGGMEAVIWTDVAQSIILLAAAVLALAFILPRLDGGPRDFFTLAAAGGKFFSRLSWSPDLTIATGWVLFFGQFFTNLISYTSNQEVVQRYLTTSDEKQAARAIWTNALVSLPSGLLFFAIGTALWVFYKERPGSLDPALARSDAIFPFFMVHELPAGVAGFVVAGIFAAAQPTSGLNSTATAFVTDVYARFVPTATDRARLGVGRVVTVVTGILGIAAALLLARYPVESLWELFLNVLGLTTGMLAGLFALGILTRRANATGALLGVGLTAIVLYLVHEQTRLYPLLYGGVAVLTCFAAGYVFSLLAPAGDKPLDGLTIHTMNRTAGRPVEEPSAPKT
jgi:solute:Na+ symporter, SSS family